MDWDRVRDVSWSTWRWSDLASGGHINFLVEGVKNARKFIFLGVSIIEGCPDLFLWPGWRQGRWGYTQIRHNFLQYLWFLIAKKLFYEWWSCHDVWFLCHFSPENDVKMEEAPSDKGDLTIYFFVVLYNFILLILCHWLVL